MRKPDTIRKQIRDLELKKEVIELKLKRKEEELQEAKSYHSPQNRRQW